MNLSVHNQSPSSAPSEQARERWLNTLSQKAKNLNGPQDLHFERRPQRPTRERDNVKPGKEL